MKKLLIFCFASMIIGATSVSAQGLLDKIERTLNTADRATNSAERANNTGKRVGALVGKKEGNSGNSTTIHVKGVSFSTLKSINESVGAAKGVSSSKIKYSKSGSSIYVSHRGSTDDLLKALQRKAPSTFSDTKLEGMEDGNITIRQ